MNDVEFTYSPLENEFNSETEKEIKRLYNLKSTEVQVSEIESADQGYREIAQVKIDLANLVKKIFDKIITADNRTPTIIAKLFNIFVLNLFKLKPEDQEVLYTFGQIYYAFNNIIKFQINIETIEFIKKSFLKDECDYNWIDTISLDNIYKGISPIDENKLKFAVRNLILLAGNEKEKEIKDIKI